MRVNRANKKAGSAANLDASVWERVVDFEKELSPTAARALLQIRFSSREHEQMSALLEKARLGALTAREEEEMEVYELLGSLLGILHSRARRALKRRAQVDFG
jgi:hypothetical protein